ncbi:MAG: hypothetical protein JSS19_10615, partial [Proteobacteria bacterium]|nr:hypothetical protein [Pseudomonadota bacterium]
LKTTYYLRTQSATHVEMSTVNTRQLNAVASGAEGQSQALDAATAVPASDVKFCAIDDPGCEACQ